MEYDKDKVDELTLALLYLVMSRDREGGKAWKGFDVQTLNRLQQKGWLADLNPKSPTVRVTPEGVQKAEELFKKYCQSK